MSSRPVVAYSSDALCDLIASSGEAVEKFRNSVHAAYFEGYFEELADKTILVEDEYVDRYYLEDYVAYYARCFHTYPGTCRRLHSNQRSHHGTNGRRRPHVRSRTGDAANEDAETLKGAARAYLKGCIPVLMIGGLYA